MSIDHDAAIRSAHFHKSADDWTGDLSRAYLDAMARLKAIEDAPARSIVEWVPVSERLPEFTPGGGDPPVLMWSPTMEADEDFPGHAIMVSNPEFVANGNAKIYGVTHWMPAPAPPIQNAKENIP
jgi:hypothetical protein